MTTWQDEAAEQPQTMGELPYEVTDDVLTVQRLLTNWPDEISWRPGSSCIELSRYACHALVKAGVAAKVVACDVWVGNHLAMEAWRAECPVPDWPAAYPGAHSVGVACESGVKINELTVPMFNEPYRQTGFGGHVVVVDPAGAWLLDMTAAQFSRPRYGWTLTPLMIGPIVDGAVSKDLGKVIVSYYPQPQFASWRNTNAWRADLSPRLVSLLAEALA